MSELPDGWILVTIEEIGEVVTGSTPLKKSPEFFGGDIPFYKPSDLDAGYKVFKAREYLSEVGAAKSRLLPPLSILVTCIGATISKTGLAHQACTTNQQINAIIPVKELISPQWLYRMITSPIVKRAIIDNSSSTTLPILNKSRFSKIVIPLAPLNEQKRIADKLDRLMAKVDNCRERLDRIPLILKRFRQSVLSAATSGELTGNWRNAKENDPITEWRGRLIGDLIIGKPRNGYSPKAVEFETSTKSLTLTATTSGRFKPQHFKYIDEVIPQDSHLWLEPEDILVQRANTLEYVGVSAIYFGLLHIFIYPDLMMKCKANSEEVLTKFLYYLLSSNEVRSYFRENATGTAGNMPKINQQTVISAPVLVPSIQEQQEIIRQVEKLFDFADRLEARYKTAHAQIDKLTPALLDKAFKGELVPQDPTEEPAAALLAKIQSNSSPAKATKTRKK